jgi:hypothetical protein
MPNCPGRMKNGSKCSEPLYKCLVCNVVGCKQPEPRMCSNQAFVKEVCIKCGSEKKELLR